MSSAATVAPESTPSCAPKLNGRPAHCPSPENRNQVATMANFGVPHDDIAQSLGISAPTLRKHYRAELDRAAAQVSLNVLRSLVHLATKRHNATAAIFWAKTRCGFKANSDAEGDSDDEF